MSFAGYPAKSQTPELVLTVVQIEGAGTSAPTKHYGEGVTVTRSAEGVYLFTFSDHQGVFLGATAQLMAETATAMAGHTTTPDYDSYSATTKALSVLVADASDAADDLEANEFMLLVAYFRRKGVAG